MCCIGRPDARTIVLNAKPDHRVVSQCRDADLASAPFECIIDDVTEDFGEVAIVAAKTDAILDLEQLCIVTILFSS